MIFSSFFSRCRFWQKRNRLFRWNSFWSWRLCKHVKFSHLGHRKPSRIYWKADAPKTLHCLVRVLAEAIFLWKWARRGRYGQLRSLSDHVERIYVHKNWRGYWQYLVSTGPRYVPHSRSCTRCFAPCFWKSLWRPRSYNLTLLDYY